MNTRFPTRPFSADQGRFWPLSASAAKIISWLRVQDDEALRRCETCEMKLIRRNQKTLREHLGHRLRPARFLHINEWLRIKLGWL